MAVNLRKPQTKELSPLETEHGIHAGQKKSEWWMICVRKQSDCSSTYLCFALMEKDIPSA